MSIPGVPAKTDAPVTRRLLVTCPLSVTAEDVAELLNGAGVVFTVEEYKA